MPKPKDFGKKSVTRNPIIADLLHRAGYIEKMGTGLMRMRKAMKEAGLEEPLFEYDGFFTVTFKRPVLKRISHEWEIDEILIREGVNEGVNEGVKKRLENEIMYIYDKGYIKRKIWKKFSTSLQRRQKEI